MRTAEPRLKIAISACFLYPDPTRTSFSKKTLQYVEQSVAHWVMSAGALSVMVPAPSGDTFRGDITLDDYATWLDGLVLHGGVDVAPETYGEARIDARWPGDPVRDAYEQALATAFSRAGKPVFGICRGLQLINVAYGGTLLQDIGTQRPDARLHRDGDAYDRHLHPIDIVPGTRLAHLLGEQSGRPVNSIHHQAIKQLAPGFVVEARSPDDGIVEAIRRTQGPYVAAVQWHPEFHRDELGTLDDTALLIDFLDAAHAARPA